MTEGQKTRLMGRKTFQAISIRSFEKNGMEIVRVASMGKVGLVIEFWTRKVSELSDKAFKRQTVVNA